MPNASSWADRGSLNSFSRSSGVEFGTIGKTRSFFFAVTVHASIVLLFRFIPYPAAAFRHGYDLSFIPSQPLRWIAVVVSAASAGICEETGFRGFMQQPIEQRHGASVAVFISWTLLGMVPTVFGAGVLLSLLAWSAGSLIPGIIGHFVMDVGLFAYWRTVIAGDFTARPITETGVDWPFFLACWVFATSLVVVLPRNMEAPCSCVHRRPATISLRTTGAHLTSVSLLEPSGFLSAHLTCGR